MRTKVLVAVTLTAGAGIVVAASCQAASFNCGAAALTKTEQAICADPAVSALDSTLGAKYSAARSAATPEEKATLSAAQKAWVAQRNQCADAACLMAAYNTRIAQLSSAQTQGLDAPPPENSAVAESAPSSKASAPPSGADDVAAKLETFWKVARQFSIKDTYLQVPKLPGGGWNCYGWPALIGAAINSSSAIERGMNWELLRELSGFYQDGTMETDGSGICSRPVDSYANKSAVFEALAGVGGGRYAVTIAADVDAIRFAMDSFSKTAGVPVKSFSVTKTKMSTIVDRFYKGEFRKPDPYQPQLDKGALAVVAKKCGETCDEEVFGFLTAPVDSPEGKVRILVRATISTFHDWYLSGSDRDLFATFGPAQPEKYGFLTVCVAAVGDRQLCTTDHSVEDKNVAVWKAAIKEQQEKQQGASRKSDM